MERLLCIVGNGMNTGGAETFLMKIYRNIVSRDYQMDFCVTGEEKCFYDDEINKLGGKIFHIKEKKKHPIKSFIELKRLVKKENYKNVIRISQHSLSALDLLAAKLGGATNLIFRSSNSNSCGSKVNSIVHILFKPLAKLVPNIMIAPSDKAAIHMFGKKNYYSGKVIILNNGLPLEKYKYDLKARNDFREKMGLQNKFVIGHVGRFAKQKNHKFLIDIFNRFLQINENAILLLVGTGAHYEEIKDYVKERGIQKSVIFLGVREDVNYIYNAMDCFILPSLYEGMPNTVVEAQASGLECIISDTITKEVNLTNRVSFCSLKSMEEWVNAIQKINISENRNDAYDILKNKGYDISDVSSKFIELCCKKR